MAHELSLILDTPVEELTPTLIGWNNSALLAAVEQSLMQYQGIVYTEAQIGDAKRDRAKLNAFSKALNDERIRIGKIYSAPLDRFKREVDEVVHRVKETVAEIDGQVSTYEDAKREEKQREIRAYFDSVIGDLAPLIPYERIHDEKWLNASVKLKSICTEIDRLLETAKNAIAAIEALHSTDEDALKAFYFRTLDLGAALMENDRLKEERSLVAKIKAEREAAIAARSLESDRDSSPPHTVTVSFKVTGSVSQLAELKNFLQANKIYYMKI